MKQAVDMSLHAIAAALPPARILVIDDEPGILDFVTRGLQAQGYAVDVANCAASALEAAGRQPYDLFILDLLLPDRAGDQVLSDLVNRHPGAPVVILSALSDTGSKLHSFALGAEDYLAKPFSIEELLARVRVCLRHARARPTRLIAAGLTLDLITRQVQHDNGRVPLAEREFLLLRELMTNAGETLSKEHLLEAVWGYRFDPGSNVVDVYVRRLRSKIGTEAIKTVRGEGYRIDAA